MRYFFLTQMLGFIHCFVKTYSFVNSVVKISEQNLKCNYCGNTASNLQCSV